MSIISFEKTVEILKSLDKIAVICHANPDGDTLGCAFALTRALKKSGKTVKVMCNSEIPKKFSYLLNNIDVDDFIPEYYIAVDVADLKLLGDEFSVKYGDKVFLAVDHHGSNREFAQNTFVDSSAAAACEIIYRIILALGVEIDVETANAIYTGISTDTGCFKYTNTSPATHRIAAEVMELGANFGMINKIMFETRTRSYVALEKLAMNSMKMFFDDRCAIITVTQDMYRKSGSDESEIDAICAIPRQIEGVDIGVTVKEKSENRYKISVRTNEPFDASQICAKLGGGGHPRAAGCEIIGSLDTVYDKLLECIEEFTQ